MGIKVPLLIIPVVAAVDPQVERKRARRVIVDAAVVGEGADARFVVEGEALLAVAVVDNEVGTRKIVVDALFIVYRLERLLASSGGGGVGFRAVEESKVGEAHRRWLRRCRR